jgi:hypothetical protein
MGLQLSQIAAVARRSSTIALEKSQTERSVQCSGGAKMADGTFTCPSCRAPYQVVKCERGPETVDHDLTCRSCEAPFPGRDGNFVLKYFMLRKADRKGAM